MATTDETANTLLCARCGDRIALETAIVPDLDFCDACLTPRNPRAHWKHEAEIPPVWFGVVVGVVLVIAIAVGLAIHGPIGGLGGAIAFAFGWPRLDARLKRGWKRQALRELGLAHLGFEDVRFAFALRAGYAGGKWLAPADAGALLDRERAIVFVGRFGRVSIPVARIRDLGWVGMRGNWWVRIEHGDGEIACFSIQEGSTAWGQAQASRSFGANLARRIIRQTSSP